MRSHPKRHAPSPSVLLLRQAMSDIDTPMDPPLILPCVGAAVLSSPIMIAASTDAVCMIDWDTARPQPFC